MHTKPAEINEYAAYNYFKLNIDFLWFTLNVVVMLRKNTFM